MKIVVIIEKDTRCSKLTKENRDDMSRAYLAPTDLIFDDRSRGCVARQHSPCYAS